MISNTNINFLNFCGSSERVSCIYNSSLGSYGTSEPISVGENCIISSSCGYDYEAKKKIESHQKYLHTVIIFHISTQHSVISKLLLDFLQMISLLRIQPCLAFLLKKLFLVIQIQSKRQFLLFPNLPLLSQLSQFFLTLVLNVQKQKIWEFQILFQNLFVVLRLRMSSIKRFTPISCCILCHNYLSKIL